MWHRSGPFTPSGSVERRDSADATPREDSLPPHRRARTRDAAARPLIPPPAGGAVEYDIKVKLFVAGVKKSPSGHSLWVAAR